MLKAIKQSSKDSLVYGLGNMAVKVVGFILIPLYTNPDFFTVEDFGILTLLDLSSLVLISLMASALPQSLVRWYWDKDHTDHRKQIFFMSFSAQIAISVIFIVLLFPLTEQISLLLFETPDWSEVIRVMVCATALQAINNIINMLMRVQSRSFLYTVTNLSKLLVVLILTIFLITQKGAGIKGIYIAQATGNLLFIAFLSGYAVRNCTPSFNFNIFRAMTGYGYPLMIGNFAAAVLAAIDRFSLNSLSLLRFVAIYSLAYKIASVLKLVIVDSVKMALAPLIIKKIDTPGDKRFYSKTLLYSSFVLMTGIIGISLFSYEIIRLISGSDAFWEAYMLVPLLSVSVFFVNMRETTNYGLIIMKKTGIISAVVVVSGILNIGLNILLIPRFDVMGAASATIVTNLIYWFACYYFSQRIWYVPYEIRKVAILFITGVALSFSGLLLSDISIIPRLILKFVILGSFPFILYLFSFYEPAEIQAIRGFVSKWSDLKRLRANLRSLRPNDDEDKMI